MSTPKPIRKTIAAMMSNTMIVDIRKTALPVLHHIYIGDGAQDAYDNICNNKIFHKIILGFQQRNAGNKKCYAAYETRSKGRYAYDGTGRCGYEKTDDG